jgi:hypothetical protein
MNLPTLFCADVAAVSSEQNWDTEAHNAGRMRPHYRYKQRYKAGHRHRHDTAAVAATRVEIAVAQSCRSRSLCGRAEADPPAAEFRPEFANISPVRPESILARRGPCGPVCGQCRSARSWGRLGDSITVSTQIRFSVQTGGHLTGSRPAVSLTPDYRCAQEIS